MIGRIRVCLMLNQGDLQKRKVKVAWKDVCQPENNGGLGFKPIKQWNNALLMKHLWNLWNNLLDLREGVRKHMQYKVGNGCNIFMWHDSWSLLPTLDTIISRRDVYAAGFSNEDSIADCVENNSWTWPDQRFIEHPILNQYFVPMLNANTKDKL
ncbi:hypothetical protein Tco_1566093, partial [Tanacetum coccineum]